MLSTINLGKLLLFCWFAYVFYVPNTLNACHKTLKYARDLGVNKKTYIMNFLCFATVVILPHKLQQKAQNVEKKKLREHF